MVRKTVSFTKNSSNLFFHILTKCNLSCTHCYINHKEHGTNTLDIDTIKKWLSIFAEKDRNTNLIFLGGEPTLHPNLNDAVKEAKRLRFQSITIDTNGYLFNDILDKISSDEVDFLSFSIDGALKKTNDSIRGKGSYDTVLQGINKACLKGFSCSLIYTVSSQNIDELIMMPDFVNNLGIKHFFIQVIGIRGNNQSGQKNKQVSYNKWFDIVPKTAEKIASNGIKVTYPKVFLDNDEIFECAGKVASNYFVFPNGRVYQCPICEDFPFHSFEIVNNKLVRKEKINETDFFKLNIPEGCVMNKIIQPNNLSYKEDNTPQYKIACCMLKQEISMIP